MNETRFEKAAGRSERVLLARDGGEPPIEGTAAWQGGRRAGERLAAVMDARGELQTGSWPSHTNIHTVSGYRVSKSVQYNDEAATVAARAKLEDISDDELVQALFDEVEAYRFESGATATAVALGKVRPGVGTQKRVRETAEAERQAAEAARASEDQYRREQEERIGAMTAVATGDANEAEARAIRERIDRAVRHAKDGTARCVQTARRGRLPTLQGEEMLGSLERMRYR